MSKSLLYKQAFCILAMNANGHFAYKYCVGLRKRKEEVSLVSTKKSQGPLLFIHQPFSRTPSNKNMQEVYSSKSNQEEIVEEKGPEIESKLGISLAKKEIDEEIDTKLEKPDSKPEKAELKSEKTELKQASHQKGKQRAALNRVKPFKEMDVVERLDYLINFPKVLPPVPCVFYTAEKNYQGYLTEYNHQYVTIQFYDQTSKTIPLNELKNIMMIGIKR
jgi:hypothetical protein